MNVKRMTMISSMALAIWAPAAAADVIFTVGNHPQPDENNILFAAGETGTLITGEVDHSGVGVDFSSLTGQTLLQNAEGQASITEVNGDPLTSMFMQVPGYTFGDFILNLENGTGSATVVAVDNFNETFEYDRGNGQNYLTITTANNESIASVSVTLSSGGGFDVFKQPRISQVCNTQTTLCLPSPDVELPEPGILSLIMWGLGGIGLSSFRQKKSAI